MTDRRATLARPATAVAAGVLLALAASAAPVLAKEGLEARLDAPIARGTPGGTTLLVGMTVVAPDGATIHPVMGSPIYLRLTGSDRTSTRELGRETGGAGHYVMRIEVPKSGIAAVEVGIHGTSDLPIEIVGTELVPGGITASTAQLAPPLAPALTPLPRPSVAAPPVAAPVTKPAGQPAQPVAQPAAQPAAAGPLPWAAWPVVAVVALAAAGLAVLAIRRVRSGGGLRASRRAHEA